MFKITNCNDQVLNYKYFLFPAGEVGIKLDRSYSFFASPSSRLYKITARLHNSNDLMSLAMIKNAMLNQDPEAQIDLFLPYVPYARQDRVCDSGEAFSLKVFADLLNSLRFHSVTICDPHSEVTPALIDKVRVNSQLDIIQKFGALRNRITNNTNCVFVSPDAGSNKKTSILAGFFNHTRFIRADKLRNLATGEIKETIVYCDDLAGTDAIVCDDICDGGKTFIELAAVLKTKNCGKVILYVTHGVFSKGVDHLLQNGIDEIYTTDSFTANLQGYLPEAPKLNIHKL